MNNITYTNQDIINAFHNIDPSWQLLKSSGLSLNNLTNSRSDIFDISRLKLLTLSAENYESIMLYLLGKANKTVTNINNSIGLKSISYLTTVYNIERPIIDALCKAESGSINNTRMTIRFEIHIFDKYYKLYDNNSYNNNFAQYFKYTGFIEHYWRATLVDDYNKLHIGSQDSEWNCFNFACTLNSSAAKMSISMGSFQIMGFNHKRCKYDTVEAMYDKLSLGYDYQLDAFINYVESDNKLITALQNKDFDKIAERYNGTGQIKTYSAIIQKIYNSLL